MKLDKTARKQTLPVKHSSRLHDAIYTARLLVKSRTTRHNRARTGLIIGDRLLKSFIEHSKMLLPTVVLLTILAFARATSNPLLRILPDESLAKLQFNANFASDADLDAVSSLKARILWILLKTFEIFKSLYTDLIV